MTADRVTVSLPVDDVAFLRGFDPDRDRSASRADMVRVIEHLQAALADQAAASGADREACACPADWMRAEWSGPRTVRGDHHLSDCPLRYFPPSGADQPTLRDQLADVALHHQRPGISVCGCGGMRLGESYPEHLADALLPVIEADRERAKAEGGAEALEQAADEVRWLRRGLSTERDLRARAAALRAGADSC